ncbi:MAG: DUF3857 domain-containing protein [Rubrivivax sp.]|nr:MAG: DUF3857 domain-containing protein [Rubrivivax sp.]
MVGKPLTWGKWFGHGDARKLHDGARRKAQVAFRARRGDVSLAYRVVTMTINRARPVEHRRHDTGHGRAWLARHLNRVIAAFGVAMACVAVAAPAGKDYQIGEPPSWIEPMAPESGYVVPQGQVSDGVYYLLVDTQTRVQQHQRTTYRHMAAKALNEKGVESVAHVEVAFDPSYQTLTLNAINVHRDGRVLPRLKDATVRVLQREKDLEALIYDGTKTANVFIEDVRVGDIVEYAYSLRGVNPAFAGHHFGRIDLQWRVPVHRVSARLLVPADAPLQIARRHTELQAVVSERAGMREYRWQATERAPLVLEGDAPGWFDPYPNVQWSQFADWQAVARWARPLYQVPAVTDPLLQAEIARIARASSDPQERLLAALRFVQRDVRYLGVEVGAGSYVPNDPALVLQRRFGDCKDKTLLTLTLLQALGVEARPALVHTTVGRGIRDTQPSPGAFNHVLVVARLHGRDIWLDPTRPPQMGRLDALHQPDFGYALVIDDQTRTLTPMSDGTRPAEKRTVHALLDAQGDAKAPVRYSVTSVFEGGAAESMRHRLAVENREELQKRYVNHYARYYPGLSMATPMDIVDDTAGNRLTTTEHYLIPALWKHSDERQRDEAAIYAPDLESLLVNPQDSTRVAPLTMPYPLEVIHTTELRLPDSWSIKPESATVTDAAFVLQRTTAVAGRTITLTDRLRFLDDHVKPAQMQGFIANLDKARGLVRYELYWNRQGSPQANGVARFNFPVAMISVLLTGLWIWLAVRLYRYDPPPRPGSLASPFDREAGIGGWLLLPALGVVLAPFRLVQAIAEILPSYAAGPWAALTTPGTAAYHPLWAPVLLFEMGMNLALLVCSLLLLVLFFRKRSSAPRLYIGFMGLSIVVLLTDYCLVQSMSLAQHQVSAKEWSELGRNSLWGLIWMAYFLKSERVKKTFVNTWRPAVLAQAPAAAEAALAA